MSKNLEDIARLAGVSRSTVSRVINNNPNVNSETRRRVLEVIEQQQFKPHHIARALVTRRTRVISLVIPQPVAFTFSDPFLAAITEHVIQQARQNNYAVMLWIGDSDETGVEYYYRIIGNRLTDGLLITSAVDDDPLVPLLIESSFPFVVIGGTPHPGINYVDTDNIAGSQTAVAHLTASGRRRIGIITGPLNMSASCQRLAGYRQYLQETPGLDYDENLISEGDFTETSGYECMQALLQKGVDAVFASSDLMAVGALRAAHEAGCSVPGDVAIMGFDGISVGRLTTPALSTMRQPTSELGARATQGLIDLIEGKLHQPLEVLLPAELIIRETCGGIPERG